MTLALTLLGMAIGAPSPVYIQGNTSGLGLLHELVDANFTIMADAYYEIKDEGYYSPDVFEGYVGQPVIQVTIGASLDYWSTLLQVIRVRAHHEFNLGKLTLGLSYHLSTKYFDEACL